MSKGNYGRVPSEPDPRDFKLERFLGITDPLDALLATMNAPGSGAAPIVKKILNEMVPRLKKVEANLPVPTPTPTPVPTSADWNNPRNTLDQGSTPHCVGFGWAQWGNTSPINDSFTNTDGHAIYYECKVIDGEPRVENGSEVRSGAKAMRDRGRLSTYAFATSLDTAIEWVMTKGPLVVGSDFTWDMEDPDSNGLVHPTGGIAGGHCYLMVGYNKTTDLIKFLNSWGSSWGVNGYFYMKKSEFNTLFQHYGELCTSIEI